MAIEFDLNCSRQCSCARVHVHSNANDCYTWTRTSGMNEEEEDIVARYGYILREMCFTYVCNQQFAPLLALQERT